VPGGSIIKVLYLNTHCTVSHQGAQLYNDNNDFRQKREESLRGCFLYPAGGLHRHLVLLGKAGEHFGLDASGEGNEGHEAEDDEGELPAEVEGDDERHADVGH